MPNLGKCSLPEPSRRPNDAVNLRVERQHRELASMTRADTRRVNRVATSAGGLGVLERASTRALSMASKSKFDRRSRPLPDYSTKVRRWAALADANEIKELRAHAKRYALVLPAHLDAESILLELCVTTLQRMFRLRLTLYKTFGNLLFARSVQPDEKAADYGQPRAADFGTVAWSAETEDSPYLVCSDATSPRLLANFLRYGPWKIPRPDLLITVVGGARNFELQPCAASPPALLRRRLLRHRHHRHRRPPRHRAGRSSPASSPRASARRRSPRTP